MEDLKRRGQDPLFTAGLVAMAKQYQLLKTKPSKLFHTFRKSSILISKRANTSRRVARHQGLMIGCQPTAVAHSKSGSGSKRHFSSGCHSLSLSVALNITLAKKTLRNSTPSPLSSRRQDVGFQRHTTPFHPSLNVLPLRRGMRRGRGALKINSHSH